MHQDFLPTASLERLKQRAEIYSRIRSFFDHRGFFEVETPILSHDTCVDRHLHPIAVKVESILGTNSGSGNSGSLWLQTSPEFGMKRLLAAGATAIYQISKVFRGGESGGRHNPEFTMLEWYRVGDNLQTGMNFLSEFIRTIVGSTQVEQISYRELFQNFLDIDPHRASIAELQFIARKNGIHLDEGDSETQSDKDLYLNLLLSQVIEPNLGIQHPVIVFDWPESQSALARVRQEMPPVSERFELFVKGLEIANGYHELLDADELRVRNRRQNQLRLADGSLPLPEESRLLAAMEAGLPACAGVALGVDRLAMLLLGASKIEEVMSFPFERA